MTLLGTTLVTAATCVVAQTYPERPVRLIVPIAAGGSSDVLARAVAQKLSESLGQSVMVDNRPGGSSIIGHDLAAKAPPDGYTILLVSTSFVVNPSLYSKLPHDTLKDLTPITLLAVAPYFLTVHPSLPVKSPAQLIALAKARPGALNYGSGGNGTGTHMAMELFKSKAGINITHIPYKGSGQAIVDLMAGQVQALFVNIIAGVPHMKAGKMRALGVSGAKRSAVSPEIPTISESGLPGFEDYGIFGIVAPAGTPREIINRLNTEIVRAINQPDIKARQASEGVEVVGNRPEEFAALIRADIAKWAEVIKSSGIRVE